MKQPHRSLVETVLHSNVHQMKPYRKNWCIETDHQKWIAKHVHPTWLRWWVQVDYELRLRGFTSMQPIRSDGGEWLFMPFIEGKTGRYSIREDVEKMVETLAIFHRLGRRLMTPPIDEAAFLLSERIADRLNQFYRVLQKVEQLEAPLRELLLAHGRDFYLDGLAAWERLRQLPLTRFSLKERRLHALSHRDLASHNWMVDKAGRVWLIDFETASYDAQIGDVWQMVSRILVENEWSEEWLRMFLVQYEKERHLSSFEKKVLSVLLAFPNEFMREAVGLAEQKRGYRLKYSLPYLHKIAECRSKWKSQSKQLFYW
ncbi:hypothetical protein ADL26_00895 [Thermoactinomyces vulgaris]|jgi:hypothetical protein|nr:hypothetical protein ADL26_00895 [Thermoactinomyces vulgaris]